MRTYTSVRSVVEQLHPINPLHVFRPHAVEQAASCFLKNFRGTVMYAVKTNPEPYALKALYAAGIRAFDVASIDEVRRVHALFPDATLYYMHTVKARHAIREAYHKYGVRSFSLDTHDELLKIMAETDQADDLNLYVRIAIPNSFAEYTLTDKFGTTGKDAVALLKAARAVAGRLGVCFHVGSQCMHSDAYRIAMRMVHKIIKQAGVRVDALDVGGGFPSLYPGMTPAPIHSFFKTIHQEFAKIKGASDMELLCEPGRALVAESGSVIVRVDLRKGDKLYINDGTYGSLFDAGIPKFIFPVDHIRVGEGEMNNHTSFSFFGPTCDTLDFMKGPFLLPEDTKEGDYIEIGQLGSYSRSMVTAFNGFAPEREVVVVEDAPLMSIYGPSRQVQQDANEQQVSAA